MTSTIALTNATKLLTRHHRLQVSSSRGLAPAPNSTRPPPPPPSPSSSFSSPTVPPLHVHRRTMATGTRGARGHGWLQKYRAGLGGRHLQGRWHYRDVDELESINDEVFAMNASSATVVVGTEAYLDLSVGDEPPRRVIIELASAALPKTTENFRLLCQERGGHGTGYASSSVYKIEKTVGLCLGDLVSDDGSGGRCHPKMGTYTSPYSFEDEGFLVSHTGPGIVSMMSPGVHRNDSRFLITTTGAPQLDGRFVAFGRVKEGMNVINDIATGVFTKRGRPTVDIKIADCGVL